MVSAGFIAGTKSTNSNPLEFPSEKLSENVELVSNSYTMVEANVIDGETIPFVELPELTVSADYTPKNMYRAKLVDGEIIAVVDLPELNIYSE